MKSRSEEPRLRPCVSYEDAHDGEFYVHLMGERGKSLCGRGAVGIGNTINPEYQICPACLEASGQRESKREPEQVKLF